MTWIPSDYIKRQGSEYQLHCPVCEKNNLWWNPSKGAGQCWSCGKGYGLRAIKELVQGRDHWLPQLELNDLLPKPKPAETQAPVEAEAWQLTWYLKDIRRLTDDQILKLGAKYEPATDSAVIPVYSKLGRGCTATNATMSRVCDPDRGGWRYQGELPKSSCWHYYAAHLGSIRAAGGMPPENAVVFVEGIFDVWSPGLEDRAVALLGTKLYEYGEWWCWQHLFQKEAVVWLDPDDPGRDGAAKLAGFLQQVCKKVTVINYPKEPGDCTPEEAREVLDNA